jgi:hypothetical protein
VFRFFFPFLCNSLDLSKLSFFPFLCNSLDLSKLSLCTRIVLKTTSMAMNCGDLSGLDPRRGSWGRGKIFPGAMLGMGSGGILFTQGKPVAIPRLTGVAVGPHPFNALRNRVHVEGWERRSTGQLPNTMHIFRPFVNYATCSLCLSHVEH